jgi:hypothetical protein
VETTLYRKIYLIKTDCINKNSSFTLRVKECLKTIQTWMRDPRTKNVLIKKSFFNFTKTIKRDEKVFP